MEETEMHLFFTCNFARAAWFGKPWYIKTDVLVNDTDSLSHLLSKMLNMNHPHASIENILTFMWCIWKVRNDYLFNKKFSHPNQIHHMANALNQNLEKYDVFQVHASKLQVIQEKKDYRDIKEGETIKSDLQVQGSKIFSDAAWKPKKNLKAGETKITGLGVYCQINSTGQPESNNSAPSFYRENTLSSSCGSPWSSSCNKNSPTTEGQSNHLSNRQSLIGKGSSIKSFRRTGPLGNQRFNC
jgi:hypothetical protein